MSENGVFGRSEGGIQRNKGGAEVRKGRDAEIG